MSITPRLGGIFAAAAAVVLLGVPGTAAAHQASCPELWNPHGQTTPPAGSTTLPGARGGQNEDGFYQVVACRTPGALVCPSADNPEFAAPCYCADETEEDVFLIDGCGDGGGGTGFLYDGDPSTSCDQETGVGCEPFPFGTVVKYTEANGKTPDQKVMAGGSESSDAVAWHLWGQGDLLVVAEFDPSTTSCCHVPEPPK